MDDDDDDDAESFLRRRQFFVSVPPLRAAIGDAAEFLDSSGPMPAVPIEFHPSTTVPHRHHWISDVADSKTVEEEERCPKTATVVGWP